MKIGIIDPVSYTHLVPKLISDESCERTSKVIGMKWSSLPKPDKYRQNKEKTKNINKKTSHLLNQNKSCLLYTSFTILQLVFYFYIIDY